MVFIDYKHRKTIWIYIQATKLPIFVKNRRDIKVESVGGKAPPPLNRNRASIAIGLNNVVWHRFLNSLIVHKIFSLGSFLQNWDAIPKFHKQIWLEYANCIGKFVLNTKLQPEEVCFSRDKELEGNRIKIVPSPILETGCFNDFFSNLNKTVSNFHGM